MPTVDDLMAKISVLATARVRRYACNRPGYKGNETDAHLSKKIDQLTAELRANLEALCTIPSKTTKTS